MKAILLSRNETSSPELWTNKRKNERVTELAGEGINELLKLNALA